MKYRIELGDAFRDYRATSVHEFRNDVIYAPEEDGYSYFVDGKSVSRNDALDAADKAIQAKLDKKSETHKRIRVSIGASNLPNTYVSKWIRK